MSSWSSEWLWAQCLFAAALLFLLGYMELPDANDLSVVSGKVESVRVISRKGLGSANELTVRSSNGAKHRVLIDRDNRINQAVEDLIGHGVTASLNWSSKAVELETQGNPSELADVVRANASSGSRTYDAMAWIALIIGLSLAARTITREMR
jgi:hypothetical protein